MLSIAALTAASSTASAAFTAMISPSSHPCMRRVSNTHYRYDPYKISAQAVAAMAAAAAGNTFQFTAPVVAAPAPAAVPVPRRVVVPSTAPRFATVAFKHETRTFLAPFKVCVGDLVVVDGDRGENLGEVSHITTDAPEAGICKDQRIQRRATADDKAAFARKREKELKAADEIRAIAKTVRLNATVVDAEYQFDMNKLTVFVERASKTTFVDFRKLQRSLFRQFQCRIWCAYMDEINEPHVAKAKTSRSGSVSQSSENSEAIA